MLYSFLLFIYSFNALHRVSSLVLREEQEPENREPRIGWREGKRSRPSPVVQFKSEYFDYPGLKDVLAAISSARQSGDQPLRLGRPARKRQIDRENLAAFALRVNPVIPRNPLSVRNYSKVCQEKKIWCAEMPTPKPKICPAADTPSPMPVTCGPTKPPFSSAIYCNFAKTFNPVGHDPCDECATTPRTTTEYVACLSVPAPTAFARLRLCSPTTGRCHEVPCTYRSVMPLGTEPPPTPPKCDIGSLLDVRNPDSRYYILVKRSPGKWRAKRSRQSRQRRRFRIVPDAS